ncbi:cupin domain-containing protein [Maritalea porphyrae]|uniref:Cupin n=1 Tax=Maritalea porphyrae TaxID=880732 RepID=A0ABQ5UMV2_9HYPH|nr:cupin domain-containing protein [Maritalea porphyrae]GLQ16543.1 cupin [Maritalea porphyrae]
MQNKYPIVEASDGVTRQVLSENKELMVVSFCFEKGGEGALHNHRHTQSTFVRSGRFKFTVGSNEFEVSGGDSFVIPSGETHGCVCLEEGELIDGFTPRRDDFL